ncbi:ketose-bisphosphate aldolase [Ureaplasma sp. ES3154-GEN]|uniref:ketose-bisphosphate aldolase n=1 Tax=Ureaplasma sp. ES3154-GEN TaxID=2984844 RepID=UPI0021E91059|nr:ketose-bisphosphate aldolase [Ureaplasma sp. ES3154-GEN]MCV3743481.1 ketose-bisphosphate aldolase [Ureaplasma sp. ES3154-GEN]
MQKKIVNATAMVKHAYDNQYALPAFNVNNLEWLKAILVTLNKTRTPALLAFSEGAIRYMGGYQTVYDLVVNMVNYLDIDIPVCLHLDHGTFDGCFKAIDVGFTSVMFDGSHLNFADNFSQSQKVIAYAKEHNVSVELEVGSIGGVEDDIVADGELAPVGDVLQMAKLQPSMLACGIGNIHGLYPKNWKGLHFDLLNEINQTIRIPLTLHGGSGIPSEQVLQAVSMGIAKININTEVQLAYAYSLQAYFKNRDLKEDKAYAFRTIAEYAATDISKQIANIVYELKANNRV